MSEAPKRIMVSECGKAIVTDQTALPNDVEYFHRAAVLAAIKRALEAAASVEIVDDPDRKMDPMIAVVIRDLIPAQFIEEPMK